ncbi:type I-E CRISPR-associated protein Cse2/CasB [Pseudomonas aeruginosa]|uniref:type I-E CRISPR-associated protein Cse2/CasB n=1 Tax=Pseudomonas aeruginosa TaxID=287 RepID=UPI00071B0C3C|nr:type I-E CRISPR-associated protein Cse2/CasB [Pseudomonas aeruginosa]HDK9341666.1 type I-E CRISPR-associated protein Cse2/CasB [Staphylococcus aureus]EIU1322912.1 type I-E CRISPR-associated protein Cse2/CasB [Pseudomonas aeruginosa]EKZ9523299.1 type I-E CRISPR-associated protein Cse2/CasB [Pseudomonas aeruginosa]EME5358153.1 type I-E CRISPR-associated protein Cse2/CasB [Pseudomonas aeruginosa]KSQ03662.1 type I-E CRISPR-associated protein Cse2/CasB [Pseudomonas aeruginosa]
MSAAEHPFIGHLQRLQNDRGALAVLRRSLGFAPGAYVPAYPYVERFVGAERHAHDAWRLALYLTAGLFASHPEQGPASLATRFGELMKARDSASIERRFIALLSADAENLSVYLRQVVSLLAAGKLAFDYGALLNDLAHWLDPYLPVARGDAIRQRWARDFYAALANTTDTSLHKD